VKKFNPLLLTDFYKVHHKEMYPTGTNKIYSNMTPRKSRLKGIDYVVAVGFQFFVVEYLIRQFNEQFFQRPLDEVIDEYQRHIPLTNVDHIKALHKLGYLPVKIKALPEGSIVPIGVPVLTITNTVDEFFWVTNYLETLMSNELWQIMTSATIAHDFKRIITKYANETGDPSMIQWQGHDFSFRGLSSVESGILSGMGHLFSFTGTDTIPAIYALEEYYGAKGLIGASVPATEHSIEMMHYDYTTNSEQAYLSHLIKQYPSGILSMVSDGKDLWKVITQLLPANKKEIMGRDGKLVIRPDSGNPVDILCGLPANDWTRSISQIPVQKGVVELLWDTFGGTVNEKGYKVLDPHIGAIYGDSITRETAVEIFERLKTKGFASTNVVLGIGSFTYQYVTRDSLGFAIKATYGEVNGQPREIFKDPITDNGTKKSAKGLLSVIETKKGLELVQQVTPEQEEMGELETIFLNGKSLRTETLEGIRKRLNESNNI
jgi:nicotinamide phosphoribosyltransferase